MENSRVVAVFPLFYFTYTFRVRGRWNERSNSAAFEFHLKSPENL